MNRIARISLAAVIPSLLAGCAAHYPPLVTMPPAGVSVQNGRGVPIAPGDELQGILAEAHNLQVDYARNYLKTAKWADLAQLPLVALGSVAALVLFNNRTNAARDAGRLAIGAGAYAGARSALTNPKMSQYYFAGHTALNCVISEAGLFVRAAETDKDGRNSEIQLMESGLQKLSDQRWELEQALNRPVAQAPTKQETELIAAARAMARLALDNAAAVETAALAESAAFDASPAVFRVAVGSISVWVATQARERPQQDFAQLRDSLLKSAKPPQTGSPEGLGADWLAQVNLTTKGLLQASEALKRATRPFTAALAKVRTCTTTIG